MEHVDDTAKRTHHVPLIRTKLERFYGEGCTVDVKDYGAHTPVEYWVHDGSNRIAAIQVSDEVLVDSRPDRELEDAALLAAQKAPPAASGYALLVTDQRTGGIAVHLERAQRRAR